MSGERSWAAIAMILPMWGLALAAALLPPALITGLLARGVGEGRPSWVVLGAIAGAAWLLGVYLVFFKRRPAAGPPPTA